MKGNNIYFAVFLLSTLYAVCSFYCPSSQLSYEDCSRYYSEVEAALLKDQLNRYKLQEEFFPSLHSAPLYGFVHYTNVTDDQDFWHFCYSWSSSVLLGYINPTTLSTLQLQLMELLFATTGVYYLSNLYSYFDEVIDAELCFASTKRKHMYNFSIVQLNFTLDLDGYIPYEAAKVILMDLTSWVSIYLPGLI